MRADFWVPCFYQPIRSSLMWVYEGCTRYRDRALSARSGLWTGGQALAALADRAALHDIQVTADGLARSIAGEVRVIRSA